MEETTQCIEFTIDELQALHSVSNIAQVLKICFLYASDEAFHALCSIVMNGKDLSSTSKRIKRDARIDLYTKIVSTQHPHLRDYVHKSLTYFEFALACRTFSERWSTQFPIDELISLAILVDKHETGKVTFDGFMEFMEDVEAAFHRNPSYPNDALDALYDGKRETLFKHVMVAFTSIDLRNKLAYLSSLASQFHMQPLTALYELTHGEEEAETENVIGFVIQLTGAVNKGIKDIEEARERQAQANRSAFSSPSGSSKSSRSSPRSSNHSHGSPADSISFALESDGARLGSELERTTGSMDLSAILADAAVDHNKPNDDKHQHHHSHSQHQNHHHHLSKEHENPLSNPDAVLMSLYAFQNKAQQIAMVLSNSKAPTSSSSEVQAGSGTEGEAQAEVSVVGGESAPAATLPTLSAPELLQQLQLMEEEIRRAKLIVDPSLAQATITSSEVSHFDTRKSAQDDPHAHHTTSDSSHKHHHESQHNTQHSHPHSHKADSATTATSTTEGQKVLSLSTPSSKKTHENRQFSLSASSVGSPSIDGRNSTSRKGHSGTASQRIYASSPHSPRSVLSSSKASQNSHHQHQHSKLQDVSFASGGLMNLSLSRSKLDSSGRINRSSPLVRHVDLSIFKSPKSHCRNVSRNVYDDAKLTWVSTQKTAAAKKERFQSTNDLMLAKEVNPVFFSNDV